MDYSPRETMDVILKRWFVIVLCTLAGGGIGWLFHQFQPPMYEASAVMTVTINYNQPDLLPSLDNDHYAEDQMISAAMDLVISMPVFDQVGQDAADLTLAPGDIAYDTRMVIERRQAEVEFIVRHEDPQKAARLANIWVKRGYEALLEAHKHALRVYSLNYYVKGLTECLTAKADLQGICQQTSLVEIDQELKKAEAELSSETQASKGITPAMLFDLPRQAEIPQSPVLYGTQGLILAGGLLGFLVGLLLSIFRLK